MKDFCAPRISKAVFCWDLGKEWCQGRSRGRLASIFNCTSWPWVWVPVFPKVLLSHKYLSLWPPHHVPPDYQDMRAHTRSVISCNIWLGFAGFHVLTCVPLYPYGVQPVAPGSSEVLLLWGMQSNWKECFKFIGLLFIFKWTVFSELF